MDDWRIKQLEWEQSAGLETVADDLRRATSLRTCRVQAVDSAAEWFISSLPRAGIERLEIVLGDCEPSSLPPNASASSIQEIRICGFGQLKNLLVGELGGEADHDRPHIKVADCPCLASLSLSPTTWWNLELSGLPRFTDLESDGLQVNDADAVAPAIQAAVFRDLPSLRKLQLASCGLQSLVVDDCPLLRELSLNPGRITCSNCNHPQGDPTFPYRIRCNAAENNLKSLLSGQQWLQQLRILDLSGNRLAEADLSCLCNLSGLEQLLLDDTDASIASLVSGVKHSKLQYLSMRREQIGSNELNFLLNTFPRLRSLYLDAMLSGKLELVDRYNCNF